MRGKTRIRIAQHVPPSITFSAIGFFIAFFATGWAEAPSPMIVLFGLCAAIFASIWLLQRFVFVEVDKEVLTISTLTSNTRVWLYEVKSVKRILCTLHEASEHTKFQLSWRPYQAELLVVELDRAAQARSVPKVLDHLIFDFDAIFKADPDEEIEAYYFDLAEKLENFVLISLHAVKDPEHAKQRMSFVPDELPGGKYLKSIRKALAAAGVSSLVSETVIDMRLHKFLHGYLHKKIKDKPTFVRRHWQKNLVKQV